MTSQSIQWIESHHGGTGYGGPRTWRREQWGIPLTGVQLLMWVILVKLETTTHDGPVWLRLVRRSRLSLLPHRN